MFLICYDPFDSWSFYRGKSMCSYEYPGGERWSLRGSGRLARRSQQVIHHSHHIHFSPAPPAMFSHMIFSSSVITTYFGIKITYHKSDIMLGDFCHLRLLLVVEIIFMCLPRWPHL